ncbi:unnamed protein product, partial [Adineta ricciae]
MNRFDWNKLSPDEFQRLQDYISYAPKKVKDVVAILEKDEKWLSHKYDEQLDYTGFRQFLDLLVDNADIPEELCRHLFLSFIKRPPPIVPLDTSSAISVLPLATSTLPITTTSTTASATTAPLPLSSFSFFRAKKPIDDLANDPKTRSGICHSGKESLMRRGNSHDQHHESPGNSRQSSRKSNPSIHSIHSLHNNVVTTVNNSDDPWVFRASLSQLINRISGNELLRDNHHLHHLTAAQQQAAMVQSQQIDINTTRIY